MEAKLKDRYVVFFDGDCGFCNFWVQWILERDRKDKFLFASLQSDIGQKFLLERNLETRHFNTLYLLKPNGSYLSKSNAVLKIAQKLGGGYSLLQAGILIPKLVRDKIYDAVSKNRMKLAEKQCFVPDQNQRKKFIDM